MNNKRLRQLILMFATLTGKTESESEQIICGTETGRAVLEKNEVVLYEQQTENLYSIAQDLRQSGKYEEVVACLSTEKIASSMKSLLELERQDIKKNKEVCLVYPKLSNVGSKRKKLMQKQNELLRIKRQNKINVRRIENVNTVKG